MKAKVFFKRSALDIMGLLLISVASLMTVIPSFFFLGEPEPPKSLLK